MKIFTVTILFKPQNVKIKCINGIQLLFGFNYITWLIPNNYLPIFLRVISQTPWQSYGYPGVNEVTLKDMGKVDQYFRDTNKTKLGWNTVYGNRNTLCNDFMDCLVSPWITFCSRDPFTKGSLITTQSDPKIKHATAPELAWHVQDHDFICSLFFTDKESTFYDIWTLTDPFWNGSQTTWTLRLYFWKSIMQRNRQG